MPDPASSPPPPAKTTAREPARVVPLRRRLMLRAFGFTIITILRFLAWTLRAEVHGRERFEAAVVSGRPVILAGWHKNVLCMILLRLTVPMPPFITMISRSKDGDLIASMGPHVHTTTIRASSSRGGAVGLLAFRNAIRSRLTEGHKILAYHAVDGPRGPRYVSKPGVIAMARHTGAYIVPFACGAAPRIRAGSWDRLMLPLPFARIAFIYGQPIDIMPPRNGASPAPSAPESASSTTAPDALPAGPSFSSTDLDRILRDLALTHPLSAADETNDDPPPTSGSPSSAPS